MRQVISFLLTVLVAVPALAAASNCSTPISEERFQDLVTDVRQEFFPDLAHLNIPIRKFHQASYYLQAGVKKAALLIGKKRYHLDVNPFMLACPPEVEALRAILVHEFEHFRDYDGRSANEVVALGLRYATCKQLRARYELGSDEKALQLHLGEGLKAYRVWLYQWLSPKELRKKQTYYYTPAEIDEWTDEGLIGSSEALPSRL